MFGFGKKKEEIAVHQEAEIKKGIKYIGSIKHQPGHTLFEYNFVTKELNLPVIEETWAIVNGKTVVKKTVKRQDNCQYFEALNRKNALKKLKKVGLWTEAADRTLTTSIKQGKNP